MLLLLISGGAAMSEMLYNIEIMPTDRTWKPKPLNLHNYMSISTAFSLQEYLMDITSPHVCTPSWV